jgi:hypothetical protein
MKTILLITIAVISYRSPKIKLEMMPEKGRLEKYVKLKIKNRKRHRK